MLVLILFLKKFIQMMKFNQSGNQGSLVISHVDSKYPWYEWMRMEFYLCGLSLKTQKPILIMRKKSRQIPINRHSTKYLSRKRENYRVHQKQEKFKELTKEQLKDTWQQTVIWYSATEKKLYRKTKKIWMGFN